MKLLAFDTSTDTMSIAVQNGDVVHEFTGAGAAQASARLIPEIQALMARAGLAFTDLDGIAFGAGPGAFTGLRASCAVAQGLGFAANVPLLPINTLHAVATHIHAQTNAPLITAALDARMGEIYWQVFDFTRHPRGVALAGGEPQLSKADTQSFALCTLPTARTLLGLAGDMLAKGEQVRPAQAQPLYVRNKVAQTTAEREALKA
ncbi:MAG: tRNA (adenosine(37)-N6)-threonylcarbamoyltransferase complex dimerization subunit type 1 TsaB [Cytophagales bacterium]|nr:tRNA (adenosine(37)-N6)-threonylcarbamoyltransferase complex dimerization subunit type 1 TsaB [Cytophagales bacterium]